MPRLSICLILCVRQSFSVSSTCANVLLSKVMGFSLCAPLFQWDVVWGGSPDKRSPLPQHAHTKALPLPLVDPHLLGGVQAGQHRSPLPRDQARVHILENTAIKTPLLGATHKLLQDCILYCVRLDINTWYSACLKTMLVHCKASVRRSQCTLGRVMTSTLSTTLRKEGGILLRMRCCRNSWAL